MFTFRHSLKPTTVFAPCPTSEPHQPHYHPGGLAKCPGIFHNCSTMGHVLVALDHAEGCQRCGAEFSF